MTATRSLQPPGLIPIGADDSIRAHRFGHQAMATLFEIVCVHEDARYAGQAARAAFDLIDRLETELTRHRSSSDIARLNRMGSGETVAVGSWAMECLLIARQFHSETGGAFDVSLGTGLDAVELIPGEGRVRMHADNIRLDLGGIGKGYAVDRAGELLQEWGIGQALLHGGCSSVLALDPPPEREGWPLTLSLPAEGAVWASFTARRQAWSASGVRKHDHIMDPRTGLPVRNRTAAWVSGSLAALGAAGRGAAAAAPGGIFESGDSPSAVAEALSTAFMIMSLDGIADYCRRHPGVEVRLLQSDTGGSPGTPLMIHLTQGTGTPDSSSKP